MKTCSDLTAATAALAQAPRALDHMGCLPLISELPGKDLALYAYGKLESAHAETLREMEPGVHYWKDFTPEIVELPCPETVRAFLCAVQRFSDEDLALRDLIEYENALYREGLEACAAFAEGNPELAPFRAEIGAAKRTAPTLDAPIHGERKALARDLLKRLSGPTDCPAARLPKLDPVPPLSPFEPIPPLTCPSLQGLRRATEDLAAGRRKNTLGLRCTLLGLERLYEMKTHALFQRELTRVTEAADRSDAVERGLQSTACPPELARLLDRLAQEVGHDPETVAFLTWARKRTDVRADHCAALLSGDPAIEAGLDSVRKEVLPLDEPQTRRQELRDRAALLRREGRAMRREVDWSRMAMIGTALVAACIAYLVLLNRR